MKRRAVLRLALLLPFLALGAGGCASVTASTPPDWAYFDVVVHPGGGIPSTLGYYAGVVAWTPIGFVLGGLLPYPADEAVARKPGEALGTGLGLVLGAPFHLLALPFGSSGPPEEAPSTERRAPSGDKSPDAGDELRKKEPREP